MDIPGKIENEVLIFDCKDMSVWNLPYKMIKQLIDTFRCLYKCKSRAMFCLNTPKMFTIVWNVIYYFLSDL